MKSVNHRAIFFLAGFAIMGMPFPVLASGNILILYYLTGAALIQFALLMIVLSFLRSNRLIVTGTYLAAVIICWCVALNTPADFHPLATAIAIVFLPLVICAALRTVFPWTTVKKSRKAG